MRFHDRQEQSFPGRDALPTEEDLPGALNILDGDREHLFNDGEQRLEGCRNGSGPPDSGVPMKNLLQHLRVSRVACSVAYPSRFTPVVAMNPWGLHESKSRKHEGVD